MPAVRIGFADSAIEDMEEVKAWYLDQGMPEVGQRLISEIFDRVEAPREHPDSGRVVPEFDQPLLRELIHPQFRIVYRREPRRVRIVRVWRSERLLRLEAAT